MVTESHLACLREVPAFVPLDTVERWAEFVVRYLSLFLRNIIASELSSVLFLDEERPAPVAVIARNGPSSSPPTGSRASSSDHIWIKLLRPPFVVLFHPGMRNLDERDG
jgi:hypothetical protein